MLKLKPDDVIVIGSDGLFDNLFDLRILSIVNHQMRFVDRVNKKGYSQVARNIVKILTAEAKKIGETIGNIWTPFSLDVAREFGVLYLSGKNDDTTVMVAIITDE